MFECHNGVKTHLGKCHYMLYICHIYIHRIYAGQTLFFSSREGGYDTNDTDRYGYPVESRDRSVTLPRPLRGVSYGGLYVERGVIMF